MISVLKLQSTPPANEFITKDQLNNDQNIFPLELYFCNSCKHVQLLDVVNPSILFEDYVYVSGTSPVFVNHFKEYANSIIKRFNPDKNFLVLDIGSNDGTLLKFFQNNNEAVRIGKLGTVLGKANDDEFGVSIQNSEARLFVSKSSFS